MLAQNILTVVLICMTSGIESKLSSVMIEPKIINGKEASVNQFPYHVGIKYRLEKGKGNCHNSGTIITDRYILTTAHSFFGRK